MKYKVHFSIDSINYYLNGNLDENVSKYDASFYTLEEAIKYAQEYYIDYVCEENTDMHEFGYLVTQAKHEIEENYFTNLIYTFEYDNLVCEILEEKWLGDNDLWNLRKEINLNSVFLSDYENSFGIPAKNVYKFFEGYNDYIYDRMSSEGENNFDTAFSKYDNEEELISYCREYCCYPDLIYFDSISA